MIADLLYEFVSLSLTNLERYVRSKKKSGGESKADTKINALWYDELAKNTKGM